MNNCRKPEGFLGSVMLSMMNVGHKGLHLWGLEQIRINGTDDVLDIGCGGGTNIERLLVLASEGRVCGLDYSPVFVEKSTRLNEAAVASGRSEIKEGSVSNIPWPDGSCHCV
jgi:SAM-dependent methyltransferase